MFNKRATKDWKSCGLLKKIKTPVWRNYTWLDFSHYCQNLKFVSICIPKRTLFHINNKTQHLTKQTNQTNTTYSILHQILWISGCSAINVTTPFNLQCFVHTGILRPKFVRGTGFLRDYFFLSGCEISGSKHSVTSWATWFFFNALKEKGKPSHLNMCVSLHHHQ